MKIFGIEVTSADELQEIREAYADLERVVEDIGWINVNSGGATSQEAAKEDFERMVQRSRLAFIKNPIVAQAVTLTTNYVFGEGVSEPKAAKDNKEIQDIISEFWTSPDNKMSFTDTQSQIKISNKLQYDGEICFALRVDTDGSVYVRYFDPLSINKIINDPNDAMRPMFYKRRVNQKDQYVPDYSNGLAHLRKYKDIEWTSLLDSFGIKEEQVPENLFCYHVKINNDILDVRGIPEVYRALDWMNANSRINNDMALFIQTQAQFAWKKKFQGTKAQMQAVKSRIGQSTSLNNPARGAGSMLIENSKVSNEPIDLNPGSGQLFEIGIRRTLLMTVAAFGMMEHYFGDGAQANLATATAMELPMLKKFLARQKIWEGIYNTVLQFVIDMRLFAVSYKYFEYNPMTNRATPRKSADYKDRTIDIDFPPILEKDIKNLSDALGSAKSNQLVPIETAQRIFLQGLGVNNIDEEMQKEFAQEIQPLLGAFGQGNKAKAAEGIRRLAKFVERARLHRPNRESFAGRDQANSLKTAGRLAEKNKQVFRQMNAYLKEIGRAYNAFARDIKESMRPQVGADGKWSVKAPNIKESAHKFSRDMVSASQRFFPKAAELGAQYSEARVAVKEAREAFALGRGEIDDFVDQQIDWNRGYVEDMAPAIAENIRKKIAAHKFDTEADFYEAVDLAIKSQESRVGMYAGAFWTVEERAVKEFSRGSGINANFVGVNDDKVCEGCAAAIAGNPWPVETAPVPGEQDCVSNCRHALQLEGDDALTESDIQLMRESEEEARAGFSLITDAMESVV